MMDEQGIRAALTELKADVKSGFKDVNGRIDGLVSRGEFQAVIQRIDERHKGLRADFEESKKNSNERVDERYKGLREDFESDKVTIRWFIGIGLTIAAIAIPIITNMFP